MPRLVQAVLSGISDVYLYLFTSRVYGEQVAKWTCLIHALNWFVIYFSTRTFSNALEGLLIPIFLYYWPIREMNKITSLFFKHRRIALFIAALTFVIRPTSAILWAYFGLLHMYQLKTWGSRFTFLRDTVVMAIAVILGSSLIDRYFYGYWTFPVLNFVKFNVLEGLSEFYGSHPFLWYWYSGIPTVAGISIVWFLLEIRYKWKDPLLHVLVFFVFALSFTAHKEFRFLYPVLPIISIFCGCAIHRLNVQLGGKASRRKLFKVFQCLLILTIAVQLGMAFYFSCIHQRGPLDVMMHIQKDPTASNVFLLMPCHSVPSHAFTHRENLTLRHLDCSPPLGVKDWRSHKTETDQFYLDPLKWMIQHIPVSSPPSHIIMFDELMQNKTISDHVTFMGYDFCQRFFNAHIEGDDHRSKYIDIYCLRR